MTAVVTLPAPRGEPNTETTAANAWTIIDRHHAGDTQAFADLYRRYHDTIYRFIYYRMRNNHQLAEDLAADTFVRALKNIDNLAWQGRDPGAWLVTIARNLVADHYKSARTRLDTSVDEHHEREDHQPQPDDAAMHTELGHILSAAMQNLTAPQREVLHLRYLRGLNVDEAATVMGLQEGAVKALTFRATRALARVPQIMALLEAHRG